HRNPPKVAKKCVWRGFEVGCGPLAYTPLPHVLYRNDGDGTFTDVSKAAGISRTPGYGFAAVAGDFDNDGDPDIYVANDSVVNFLWRNNGDGTFTDVGLVAGVAYNEEGREQAGMGVDFGDINNDGLWDLFVTNFSEDSNTLYRNDGRLFFSDITFTAGLGEDSLPYLGWFCKFFDFDNDSDQDLIVANGHVWPEADRFTGAKGYAQEPLLYANKGNGSFLNVSMAAGEVFSRRAVSRGGALADYDDDGDLDVAVINLEERAWLLRNDGGNRLAWIRFRLQGTRSNRDGIGSRIIVTANGRQQHYETRSGDGYISSGDPRAHFGLGHATRAERVEVRWPSGQVDVLENLEARTEYTLREGRGIVSRRKIPAPGKARPRPRAGD
ncbi:MAG: CRTAC1 family protein, partial [Acidobacteriota bacterium]